MSQVPYEEALNRLQSMFANVDRDVIDLILRQNGGHMERTVEQLLSMTDPSVKVEAPPPNRVHQPSSGPSQSVSPPAAASASPAPGPSSFAPAPAGVAGQPNVQYMMRGANGQLIPVVPMQQLPNGALVVPPGSNVTFLNSSSASQAAALPAAAVAAAPNSHSQQPFATLPEQAASQLSDGNLPDDFLRAPSYFQWKLSKQVPQMPHPHIQHQYLAQQAAQQAAPSATQQQQPQQPQQQQQPAAPAGRNQVDEDAMLAAMLQDEMFLQDLAANPERYQDRPRRKASEQKKDGNIAGASASSSSSSSSIYPSLSSSDQGKAVPTASPATRPQAASISSNSSSSSSPALSSQPSSNRKFADYWSSLTSAAKAKVSRVATSLFAGKKNAASAEHGELSSAQYHSLPSLDDDVDSSSAEQMREKNKVDDASKKFTLENDQEVNFELDEELEREESGASLGGGDAIEMVDRKKKRPNPFKQKLNATQSTSTSDSSSATVVASSSSHDLSAPHALSDVALGGSSTSYHAIPDL